MSQAPTAEQQARIAANRAAALERRAAALERTAGDDAKRRKGNKASSFVICITGSSCSGKTTLAKALVRSLLHGGIEAELVEQDRHRRRSSDNKMPNGRKTWEGPQFTDWPRLEAAVATARRRCPVVVVEGYLLLDGHELRSQLSAILWVSSTKAQVVARRREYPAAEKLGPMVGWPSVQQYAEQCVWPVHEAYSQRVQHLLGSSLVSTATLPADEVAAARLQRAHGLVKTWLDVATTRTTASTAAAAAASASSSAATAACSSSSSSSLSPLVPPGESDAAFAPGVARGKMVLVTHGSFNPVHRGHVEMMVRIRGFLEAPAHHITSRHVTSRHVTSRHITSHHITSRHVTSRHVTSHHRCESEASSRLPHRASPSWQA